MRRLPASAPALLLAAAALLGACGEDPTVRDTRDIGAAYYALRDAILQGDDEAFFALHSAEARRWAVDGFPSIRAEFLTGSPEQKQAFLRRYRVGEEEFLRGDARALVARMMPWKSGWMERRDLYRTARLKDVSIEYIDLPGGGRERRGIVELEPPPGAAVPPGTVYPTIVFVRDPDGWRRRSFFVEVVEEGPGKGEPGRAAPGGSGPGGVEPPGRPGG